MKPSPRILISAALLVMFVLLWVTILGDNGLVELVRLQKTHQSLLKANARLTQENMQLSRAIDRLKGDPVFVENVARRELGMVRRDEMIFKFKGTP